MADSRDDPRVFLVDPEQRGVLPLDDSGRAITRHKNNRPVLRKLGGYFL